LSGVSKSKNTTKENVLNYWVFGGVANIGFLVYFLTQPLGDWTTLTWMTYKPDQASSQYLVTFALLAVAVFCFVMAFKKKK